MAKDLNKVAMIGRLTRDAALKFVGNNFAITEFSIAVNDNVKRNDNWVDEVSFFNCKIRGKRGEGLNKYLTKGKQLGIEGRLVQERWEKDGIKNQKIVILVSEVQLLGGTAGGQAQQTQEMFEEKDSANFDDGTAF